VAIFDDFISSNNTNDDFDEITATLGDVDAYIEHQQKIKSGTKLSIEIVITDCISVPLFP
jgi:hypothetical protein